ncbi:hypothetical protein [Soonwooa sp.]|uniref:hypothetical protein n=1 Tax=Soonwooa sp. TaxID=1938592 RepID=UPI002612806D|nr:hypothetical protein [Soonwooa sp.]
MTFDYPMTTLSELMTQLAQNGINKEVRMNEDKVFELQGAGKIYSNPTDLLIIRAYRFEGESNPSDSAALYVMKDKDGEISYLIEAYGAESNYDGPEFDDFLKAIPSDDNSQFRLTK